MSSEECKKPDLHLVDRPSRPWWKEGSRVVVSKAPKFRQPWSDEEYRSAMLDVLRHPEESFEDLATRLGRSPGAIQRLRCLLREAAGIVRDDTGFEPSRSRRKRIALEVLKEAGVEHWTEGEKSWYLARGHGLRSDRTAKALRMERGVVKAKAAELKKELRVQKGK
jgi:hypothetical protein